MIGGLLQCGTATDSHLELAAPRHDLSIPGRALPPTAEGSMMKFEWLERVRDFASLQAPERLWPPRRLSLALQGGGSFGAFTWGVLDRLLEEEEIEFDAISGASAGAINAVLLASGLAEGGRERARAKLEAFWRKISNCRAVHAFHPADTGRRPPTERARQLAADDGARAVQSVRSQSAARHSRGRSRFRTAERHVPDCAADRGDAGRGRAPAYFPQRRSRRRRRSWPRPACRCCTIPSMSTASPIGTAAMSPIRRSFPLALESACRRPARRANSAVEDRCGSDKCSRHRQTRRPDLSQFVAADGNRRDRSAAHDERRRLIGGPQQIRPSGDPPHRRRGRIRTSCARRRNRSRLELSRRSARQRAGRRRDLARSRSRKAEIRSRNRTRTMRLRSF